MRFRYSRPIQLGPTMFPSTLCDAQLNPLQTTMERRGTVQDEGGPPNFQFEWITQGLLLGLNPTLRRGELTHQIPKIGSVGYFLCLC